MENKELVEQGKAAVESVRKKIQPSEKKR